MIRVVADTNIVVSAFFWGGAPRGVLDAARRKEVALFTSIALLAELDEVLAREKFAKRIAAVGCSVEDLVTDYLALAQLVRAAALPRVVRGRDDDQVLACALAAKAEIIVSGDADLCALVSYHDIAIVNAGQLLQRLARR